MKNPYANEMLAFYGLKKADVPRYRDCWANSDAGVFIIHTRTGGSNAEVYADEIEAMLNNEDYLRCFDDSFDDSYAYYLFRINEGLQSWLDVKLEVKE